MSRSEKLGLSNIYIGSELEQDADFIPLITDEEEDSLESLKIPDTLPILPLRNTVLFPGVILPITIGRNKSLKLINEIYKKDKTIGTIAQKDTSIDDPGTNEL
mgnify:FL=1